MSSGLPLDELAGPHSINDDSGESSDLCSICCPRNYLQLRSQWRSCRSAPDQHQHRWRYSSLISRCQRRAGADRSCIFANTLTPEQTTKAEFWHQSQPCAPCRRQTPPRIGHSCARAWRLTLPGKLLRDFLNAGPYTATCLRVESDTMWLKKPYLNRSSSFESTCDARSSPSRRGQHSGHCNSPAPRTSC